VDWISGEHVVVTGPTSGIGRQIAIDLGSRGAELTLACRDEARGRELADTIAAAGSGARPAVLRVDFSSRDSIRAFAGVCRAVRPPIDVLINNAGTIQGERRESVDGSS